MTNFFWIDWFSSFSPDTQFIPGPRSLITEIRRWERANVISDFVWWILMPPSLFLFPPSRRILGYPWPNKVPLNPTFEFMGYWKRVMDRVWRKYFEKIDRLKGSLVGILFYPPKDWIPRGGWIPRIRYYHYVAILMMKMVLDRWAEKYRYREPIYLLVFCEDKEKCPKCVYDGDFLEGDSATEVESLYLGSLCLQRQEFLMRREGIERILKDELKKGSWDRIMEVLENNLSIEI